MTKNKKKTPKEQIKSHLKIVSGIAITYGVGEFMGAVMKDFSPDARGVKKIFIKIGTLALTGMVIKAATDYMDKEIDEAFETAEEVLKEINMKKVKEEESYDTAD